MSKVQRALLFAGLPVMVIAGTLAATGVTGVWAAVVFFVIGATAFAGHIVLRSDA
jgi:hypothetical protein